MDAEQTLEDRVIVIEERIDALQEEVDRLHEYAEKGAQQTRDLAADMWGDPGRGVVGVKALVAAHEISMQKFVTLAKASAWALSAGALSILALLIRWWLEAANPFIP